MKRAELREHIFKVVFESEFNAPEEKSNQINVYLDLVEEASEKDLEYIKSKSQAVLDHVEEIDNMINSNSKGNSKGWKTSRMNKVDLSILRLAVYEMKFDDDIPVKVAIDQAVELAKKYSGDEGPAFVNGVLAKLAD